MFDTYVTIVGNVLTAPEWRRTAQSNTLVANFKVASTARRLDRESGRWVDGNSLRVRVNCWRKLAEGVASSVMVGDPVVVAGRLYTRDWIDDAGNHRTLYELEAVTVGHDLARGRGRFMRNRPTMATSTVEDAEAENRVHGEQTEPVPDDQAPAGLDDRPLDDEFELPGLGAPRRFAGFPVGGRDLGNDLDSDLGNDLGPDPFDPPVVTDLPAGELDPLPEGAEALAGDPESSRERSPGASRERSPEVSSGASPEAAGEVSSGVQDALPSPRGRRGGRGRQPVPA